MKNEEMKVLEPINDRCKSFYKKAHYYWDGSVLILRSYNTDVAAIADDQVYRLWDGYSSTTQRHINEFLIQFTGSMEHTGKAAWEKVPYIDKWNLITKVNVA